MEFLAFNKANKKKENVAIIAEIDKKIIVRKLRLKWKKKCLYYSETPAKLIKTLDSKKEPEDSILSIL